MWFTLSGNAPAEQFTLVSTPRRARLRRRRRVPSGNLRPRHGLLRRGHALPLGGHPDSYYQIDFVCGAAIDTFGPAGSSIFYTRRCVSSRRTTTWQLRRRRQRVEHLRLGLPRPQQQRPARGSVSAWPGSRSRSPAPTTAGAASRSSGTPAPTGPTPSATSPGHLQGHRVRPVRLRGRHRLARLARRAPSPATTCSPASPSPPRPTRLSYNFGERPASLLDALGRRHAGVGVLARRRRPLIRSLNGSSGAQEPGQLARLQLPQPLREQAPVRATTWRTRRTPRSRRPSLPSSTRPPRRSRPRSPRPPCPCSSRIPASRAALRRAYGFIVTSAGISGEWINVGSAGSYLGVSNNSKLTVFDLLRRPTARPPTARSSPATTPARAIVALFDSVNESAPRLKPWQPLVPQQPGPRGRVVSLLDPTHRAGQSHSTPACSR